MGRLFGTDGVRGLANRELTCDLAYKLGQAGAYVLTGEKHKPRILIGRDTRISGDMLEAALAAGICSVGADAIVVGVLPTPAIAYLARHYGADAGAVISASHNPMEYNGIKFFNSQGYKLPDELENRIEDIILDKAEELPLSEGADLGRIVRIDDAVDEYVEFLKSTIEGDLKGFRIALDCANGAAYEAAPRLFEALGAEVHTISNEPNGVNINAGCGSTHPEKLQEFVKELGADVGLAFDGDADRLIAVDEKGEIVDGDQIMVMCALCMSERGVLKDNTVVTTVMSNLGLDLALKKAGLTSVKTKVGDRYVLEKMLDGGFSIGGEQSGHIIFLDHNTTGDGLLTALQMLGVMKRSGDKLSKLAAQMKKYPQVLVNARVSEQKKHSYADDPVIREEIGKIESRFKDEGRVLIRPSGTEPLVRVMIEGADQKEIEEYAVKLARLIEERLG
ncbi:MAG TPA: phosphoglucosamine mutase [Candidatus Atribacteria bacterium]|nr:phosphoglucosamine mutase [Candidatus Atribacteria bacterium]HPT78751.1 phosphoglucosamine mutase [Candidatus Atribacteria bacterium]